MTRIAPLRFGSLLMGVCFLSIAAAEKVVGAITAFMPVPRKRGSVTTGIMTSLVAHFARTERGFFSIFVVSSIGAAMLMVLCIPMLERLTASVRGT